MKNRPAPDKIIAATAYPKGQLYCSLKHEIETYIVQISNRRLNDYLAHLRIELERQRLMENLQNEMAVTLGSGKDDSTGPFAGFVAMEKIPEIAGKLFGLAEEADKDQRFIAEYVTPVLIASNRLLRPFLREASEKDVLLYARQHELEMGLTLDEAVSPE